MSDQRIHPETVRTPFQLLAAWLVFIIVLDGSFLGAASTIDRPGWAAGVLTVAAVANVPVLLSLIFILQTRFRPQLQADRYYAEYVREQRRTESLSARLGGRLDASGLGLVELATGGSIADLAPQIRSEVQELVSRISDDTERLELQAAAAPTWTEISPATRLDIARGLMAEQMWADAAKHLDEYVNADPANWEAQFSRGVAHANARAGAASDKSALRAYNDAVVYLPEDERDKWLPRLLTYRGAMLKRLGRLDEAERDLLLARELAPLATDDALDINYNLAGVYAMTGNAEQALQLLDTLRGTSFMDAVLAHSDDYFRSLRGDPRFRRILTA